MDGRRSICVSASTDAEGTDAAAFHPTSRQCCTNPGRRDTRDGDRQGSRALLRVRQRAPEASTPGGMARCPCVKICVWENEDSQQKSASAPKSPAPWGFLQHLFWRSTKNTSQGHGHECKNDEPRQRLLVWLAAVDFIREDGQQNDAISCSSAWTSACPAGAYHMQWHLRSCHSTLTRSSRVCSSHSMHMQSR